VGLLRAAYDAAHATIDDGVPLRILFSAHGLPEIIVRKGDPYQWQIEQTVGCLLSDWDDPKPDAVICYQSRATPQQWIGPSTDAEIERAARDKVAVLVVPVAFVSEHSETLVELDVDYRALAERLGVPGYFRVPAQNSAPGFIAALAALVRHARSHGPGLCSYRGSRICPSERQGCPML
jgi:ferrochelatase